MYHQFGTDQLQKDSIAKSPANPFFGIETKTSDKSISDKEVVYLPATWNLNNISPINSGNLSGTIEALYKHIIGEKCQGSYVEVANIVKERINKPNNKITYTDVQNHLPIDHFDYLGKIQIHEGINHLFLLYHLKSAELRELNKSQSQIESQINKAPWDIINNLLENADFPYLVTRPEGYFGNFNCRLESRKDSSLVIDFLDLSSGEKILISLGMWMYNSGKRKRLPKLLLLDEPDAHLHPSAIKKFIDVLEKTLVKKFGIKVILTTHSPSTVSFSPEYSLFEMSNTSPQIKPLESKEYGVNLLTEGLLVVKSNTKYVLVEDQNDADFYNALFTILKNQRKVNAYIGVVFIPSSNKESNNSGGCTVVRSWVEKFVSEGVFNVFQGLIDSDNGNQLTCKNIHVVNRYSLENYMLDPILVYSSLLHDNLNFNLPGVELCHKDEHKIFELPTKYLQIIADHIFSEIAVVLTGLDEEDKKLQDISFINGITLKYPNWFITHRGHDLYAKFQYKYKNAVDRHNLIKALVRHEFISVDLQILFNEIQK